MLHKTRFCDILWRCIFIWMLLTSSSQDTGHHRDDTPSNETRATVIPGSSELPENLCAPSESSHTATMSSPEKREQLHTTVWHISQRIGSMHHPGRSTITFASKSLTETETCYANIERELLAIIFGYEKFHTYLYRRTFIVETDHKPLEMISIKNLIAAPARLQRMLLRLQQYDMVITYRPGKEMLLADALSHLPSRTDTEIKRDLRFNAISMSAFTRIHLTIIAAETQRDLILSTVHRLTLNGWPQRCTNVPRIARNY